MFRVEATLFYADLVHARIESLITEMYQDLKDGQSLLVEFILNDGTRIIPASVGYQNPNFIIIHTLSPSNDDVSVYLSHTDIQFVITILNKPSERKPIGFQGKSTVDDSTENQTDSQA